MGNNAKSIALRADRLVKRLGTRNPFEIADALGIDIISCKFQNQKGAYKVILNNRFIFIKEDLEPHLRDVVVLHEIGHDTLHRDEALSCGGFVEFGIFDNLDMRMEYEANVFASQILLPDSEFLEYVGMGYDISQIAAAMNTDVNIAALKADVLAKKGYMFNKIESKNDFLK